jgi:hypothetical protein
MRNTSEPQHKTSLLVSTVKPKGAHIMTTNTYRITWTIDIEADTPEQAAARALRIQRNPDSIAVVFEVVDEATKELTTVDLHEGW